MSCILVANMVLHVVNNEPPCCEPNALKEPECCEGYSGIFADREYDAFVATVVRKCQEAGFWLPLASEPCVELSGRMVRDGVLRPYHHGVMLTNRALTLLLDAYGRKPLVPHVHVFLWYYDFESEDRNHVLLPRDGTGFYDGCYSAIMGRSKGGETSLDTAVRLVEHYTGVALDKDCLHLAGVVERVRANHTEPKHETCYVVEDCQELFAKERAL